MTVIDFFAKTVWPWVSRVSSWCFQKLCLYRWVVIIALLSVVFLPLLWSYYRAPFEQEITVLVGAPGSSSERLGARLVQTIRETPNQFGLNYRVRTEQTNGFEEIRRRLEGDASGTVIGFQIDSQAETQGLRTIYPMDFDYLHILCSRQFLEKYPGSDPAKIHDLHRVFTQIHALKKLDPQKVAGRVFLGPADGSSRVVASELFKLYHLDASILANPSIDDWNQARVGLVMGELDLVFLLSPKDATTVTRISEDQSAVLLDLGPREALRDKTEYNLWLDSFPELSYSAITIPWKPINDQPGSKPTDADTVPASSADQTAPNPASNQPKPADMPQSLVFCKSNTRTIVARRLIASSYAMNEHDAYALMGAAERTFAGSGPSVGEWSSTSPPTDGPIRTSLGIQEHKAARHFRARQQPQAWFWPTSWPSSVVTPLMAILLFVVTQIFGPKPADTEKTKEPSPAERVEGSIANQQVGEGQSAPAAAAVVAPAETVEPPKQTTPTVLELLQGDITMTRAVISKGSLTAGELRDVQKGIRELRNALGFGRRALTNEQFTDLSSQIGDLERLCPVPPKKTPEKPETPTA